MNLINQRQIDLESKIYGSGCESYFDESYYACTEDISEIRIRSGHLIDSIQVIYGTNAGKVHGGMGGTCLSIFKLKKDEHITAVYGTLGCSGKAISSLEFITDLNRQQRFGRKGHKTFEFVMHAGSYLAAIKGFDSYEGGSKTFPEWAGDYYLLPAIGFISVLSTKSTPMCQREGKIFPLPVATDEKTTNDTDSSNQHQLDTCSSDYCIESAIYGSGCESYFDELDLSSTDISEIWIRSGDLIHSIQVIYGTKIGRLHGGNRGHLSIFKLKKDEHITAVYGTLGCSGTVISSLKFTTDMGQHQTFGTADFEYFEFVLNGGACLAAIKGFDSYEGGSKQCPYWGGGEFCLLPALGFIAKYYSSNR